VRLAHLLRHHQQLGRVPEQLLARAAPVLRAGLGAVSDLLELQDQGVLVLRVLGEDPLEQRRLFLLARWCLLRLRPTNTVSDRDSSTVRQQPQQ